MPSWPSFDSSRVIFFSEDNESMILNPILCLVFSYLNPILPKPTIKNLLFSIAFEPLLNHLKEVQKQLKTINF